MWRKGRLRRGQPRNPAPPPERQGACVTRLVRRSILLLVWLLTASAPAFAQGTPPVPPPGQNPPGTPPPRLRIFLDCDSCDEEYLRQNVAFVDYVRDRTVADLHVLVT